jgi:hypothetical protein
MREAWERNWQAVRAAPSDTVSEPGRRPEITLLRAAAKLGVGVFASGPLQEGQLLQEPHLKVAHAQGGLVLRRQ